MHKIYYEFYLRETNKISKEELGEVNLNSYPYLELVGGFYQLKPFYVIGRYVNKGNFGFIIRHDGDIYVDALDSNDAKDNDIVLAKVTYEAIVVLIVKMSRDNIVATYKLSKKHQTPIYTPEINYRRTLVVKNDFSLVPGHVVNLKINSYDQKNIFATVTKIIGHKNDPDIETMKIVYSYDWPTSFSDELMDSLNDNDVNLDLEISNRLDLTNHLIVTIDGEDAKDLDDAISLHYENGLYHLGVHIADVSTYVKRNTLLDKEALRRSTSSYLADRVIPMLPHLLSNDYCSLNPNTKKLTLSCFMTINSVGEVVDYEIKKTVIISKYRLTYNKVNDLLNKDLSLGNRDLDLMIYKLHELSLILKKMRKKRGEIEFITTELGFKVDSLGKVLDIYERKIDEGEELIESMMLIANETIAKHMDQNKIPSIYRIHETPDLTKLNDALALIKKLGFNTKDKARVKNKDLQVITNEAINSKFQSIVHMNLLRAMQKARYSELRDIHFGLGATYYTHFTSPIRRYPDLLLHRLLHTHILSKDENKENKRYYTSGVIKDIATHTSNQERKAIQMERDVAKLKSCEFMLDKIGLVFDAIIVQMMPSGMFVKLSNGIEGFVPLRLLDQYYYYNDSTLTYYSTLGKEYSLANKVKVKLISVDMLTKQMDFKIINKERDINKKKK